MPEIKSTAAAAGLPAPRLQLIRNNTQKARAINPELRARIAYSFHHLELPFVIIARRLNVTYEQIGQALIHERRTAIEMARSESYRAGYLDAKGKGPTPPPPGGGRRAA